MKIKKEKIKKSLSILLSFAFAASIVLISALRVSQSQAQTAMEEEVSVEATDSGEKMAVAEKVDYYLPYPGILPDHPFYWLKMARDRLMLWLTRNPVVKVERLLLYADKRVGAAKVLVEGGKSQLGVTTATKGEKYLEQAVDQLEKIEAMPEQVDKLEKATLKHEEVLTEVLEKVPDQAKPAIKQALEKARQNNQRLKAKFD